MLRLPLARSSACSGMAKRQYYNGGHQKIIIISSSSNQVEWLKNIVATTSTLPSQTRWFSNKSTFSTTSTTASATATVSPSLNVQQHENEQDKNQKTVLKLDAYQQLAKAKLSALVVSTTAAGFVAAGGPLTDQLGLATCCVVGTALCSSSAAAWNQIFEMDRDAKMKRTQQRPLVKGDLTKTQATLAASAWGVAGTTLLAVGTDPVTTALGVSNILLYAGVYTYMKPRSIYNTWVGAVVGAIPPVMGFTAATGGALLELDAIILGSTLYLWQMPHFFALSYMHRTDYKRGGFAMVPVLEQDGERTSNIIMRYAIYLSTVPIFASLTGATSSMFALEGIALNGYALYVANKFRQERTNANARKVFLTSLWYLPSWLMLYLLHSKVWDEENKDRDMIRDTISDIIHSIRDQGRQVCIHEHVIANAKISDNPPPKNACPVEIAKKKSNNVIKAASATTTKAALMQSETKTEAP